MSNIEMAERAAHFEVLELFESAVRVQQAIIESSLCPLIHCGLSMGKDSYLVFMITVEAYARSIASGRIEAARPFVVTTVNTQAESAVMVMFVEYCIPRLKQYAEQRGVNLIFRHIKPRLVDEYFIRWGSASKLVSNPSRNGDCSKILKIDPSERFLRQLPTTLNRATDTQRYANSQIISCSGSRIAESTRRAGNMAQQGVSDKNVDALIAEMSSHRLGKVKFLQFAPIRDWSDEQVFLWHSLSGRDPMVTPHFDTRLPNFLDHAGLLLELYGNASSEVCEVVVGSTQGSGCNGKSGRYGCFLCTMVGETDRSSTNIVRYRRWSVLGAENALRIRDYLYRLSCDPSARCFHAKAYDPAYNRIALQGNVLKSSHLEHLITLAAQLSVESAIAANEFAQLVANGREMEHEGYAEIANDTSIAGKTRSAMLAMYREQAQKPIFRCFSESHAVVLSFKWSLEGVACAPYRPLAIWRDVLAGYRVPYPQLNSEYILQHGAIQMSSPMPDPVMVSFFKKTMEEPAKFLDEGRDLLEYWSRPIGKHDVFDRDMNCSLSDVAQSSLRLSVRYEVGEEGTVEVDVPRSGYFGGVQFDALPMFRCRVLRVTLDGKTLTDEALALIMPDVEREVSQHCAHLFSSLAESLWQDGDKQQPRLRDFDALYGTQTTTLELPYFSALNLAPSVRSEASTVATRVNATQRVVKRVGVKIVRGSTRMRFYPIDSVSRQSYMHLKPNSLLSLNFDVYQREQMPYVNHSHRQMDVSQVLENVDINFDTFDYWRDHQRADALEQHDRWVATSLERGLSLYRYGGSHVISELAGAGLAISSCYHDQFIKLLKRTQLFEVLGILDLQNCTKDQLLAMPNVHTMAEHRHDKARLLLEVRRRRNLDRTKVRALLGLSESERSHRVALNNSTAFFEEALRAFNLSFHGELTQVIGGGFYDSAVSLTHRSQLGRLWFALYRSALSDAKQCAEQMIGASSSRELSADVALLLDFTSHHATLRGKLANEIRREMSHWALIHSQLRELIGDLGNGEDATRATERFIAIADSNPHTAMFHLYDARSTFSGLSSRALLSRCEQAITVLTKRLHQMSEMCTSLDNDIQQEKSKVLRAMSLSERLRMMKKVA
ncbi:hypothetical protein QTV44_002501 [Vibrio vulnificus]|nr:hypothetical protein [Vibrio vulnificus]